MKTIILAGLLLSFGFVVMGQSMSFEDNKYEFINYVNMSFSINENSTVIIGAKPTYEIRMYLLTQNKKILRSF